MIDPFTFIFSVLLGFPIGGMFGVILSQWANKQFAQQTFDALVQLRAEAKAQMDKHATLQERSHYDVKRD